MGAKTSLKLMLHHSTTREETYRGYSVTQECNAEVHKPILEEKLPEARVNLLPSESCNCEAQNDKIHCHSCCTIFLASCPQD